MERKTGGLENMAQYNLKKDLNYLFAVEDKDGRFIVNAVGNVTASFPFLTEASSKLVTPFYLVKDNECGAISPNAVVVNGYTPERHVIPSVPMELRNLRMPTVALNISKDRYEKAISYVPILADVHHQTKPDGGITLFLPIIAFDADATFLHQNVFKGDTIEVIGELKFTKVSSLRTVPALWANDVRKVREAKRNVEGATV